MLQLITEENLYLQIRYATPALSEEIKRLRNLLSLDPAKYHQLKTRLPYFIGAAFTNNIRSTATFTEANYLVLDLDKLTSHNMEINEVRERIQKDEQLVLSFISPSGLGLKLLFKLDGPIANTKQFSDVYKAFALSFAKKYQLEKVIDLQTHDATRICFLSIDDKAFYNPVSEPVNWQQLLNSLPQPELPLTSEIKPEAVANNLNDEIYRAIRDKLLEKTPAQPIRQCFVPDALEPLPALIQEKATEAGLILKEVRNISHGKKFTFGLNSDFAEINVFYGKNGFSVVKSPKRGHHPELTEAAYLLVQQVIYTPLPSLPNLNTVIQAIPPEQITPENSEIIPFRYVS
ncbi:MAG: CRISPR-associated primase-polymerase type B [Hymenobacteraceae bacterium]|nr:CRISPR-associated primase-polymerase type B [Hymenobacteraceae bacterium]